MMSRPLVIAIIAFLAALALRVANAPMAFAGGAPQISPVDELYHWKRMAFSASHVPQVLEFDPDRAAFCPWPPLYDLTAGAAARILGARDADAVLRRIVWFPPLLGEAFVGIAALCRLTRAAGHPGGPWFLGWTHVALLAGAAIALRKRPIWIACGVGVALLALPSRLDGARFFTGDPWLRTIVEFQPIWKARDGDLLSLLVGLGAGVLFVWPLAIDAWRRREAARGTIALFAIIYLLLTLSSRRFWSVGIPLLALAG